jgi:glycosyltransferase involved in cell wall biosynthesis
MCRVLRRAGVTRCVSYSGVPLSSIKPLAVLVLKRLRVALLRKALGHHIFEACGIADTAVFERGIAARKTSRVILGVDTEYFRPSGGEVSYLHKAFGIPADLRVFFYSGQMETRKVVVTIMQVANLLSAARKSSDSHFLLLGNKGTDHLPYLQMLTDVAAKQVTFGGYRNDINILQRDAYAAVVVTTVCDSGPLSAVPCQARGLPRLVSDLPGINESIQSGVTGLHLPVANFPVLADVIGNLLNDLSLCNRLGAAARLRIVQSYSLGAQ